MCYLGLNSEPKLCFCYNNVVYIGIKFITIISRLFHECNEMSESDTDWPAPSIKGCIYELFI